MPEMNDIVFYPRLRYHEMRVSPEWWHPNSTEPLLYCVTGADSWRRPIHTEAELNEMIAEFKGDGWDYSPKDQEARKYIHVNELEKFKGPAPQGPF